VLLWPGAVTVGIIRFALIAFVLASLVTVAAFWNRRAWAARAEAVRLGLVTGGAIGLVLAGALRPEALAVAVAFSALSAGDLPDDDETG
jgi:hypothetical protein